MFMRAVASKSAGLAKGMKESLKQPAAEMSSMVEDPATPLVNVKHKMKLYNSKPLTSEPESPDVLARRFSTVGKRLARRKELFAQRRLTSDVSLGLALLGIVLMVVHNELRDGYVYEGNPLASDMVKLTITISTVLLLACLGLYHWLDLRLFVMNNCMEDWRLAMRCQRITFILGEFAICSVHPLPGNITLTWASLDVNALPGSHNIYVPLDVALSLPMFLRLYLVCRTILLHSKLCCGASSQSIGALNKVNSNFRFVFKSLMAVHADYVLVVIMASLFLIASWALRLCEMHSDTMHGNFLNTMWIVAITFLTIGYGDIVPNTYCGRGISVITGMMGAGCTALVVAVLARKLELSRAEKYVHDFVQDVYLSKRLKHEAAIVLQRGWMMYHQRKKKVPGTKMLDHQTRFLRAIYNVHEIKNAQRRQADNAVTLLEVSRTQSDMAMVLDGMRQTQIALEEKMRHMDHKLSALYRRIVKGDSISEVPSPSTPTGSQCRA